jgi:hypothetical protein
MTSQGTASGSFTRAIQQRNLFAAEIALKEMGNPSLIALDYLVCWRASGPRSIRSLPCPALRWHGRFELEARTLTLAESQLALSALVALGEGDAEAIGHITFHGLRRTFASLRSYGGKSHRQTADLLGHEDVRFTLNVYAQSGLDPDEMLPPVRKAFDWALEWAATRR